MNASAEAGATLVYDGACPFCSRYAALLRLRAAVGPLRLVDARAHAQSRRAARERGFDLDRGMWLQLGEQDYYGADALRMLALLSSRSGWFNRLNYRLFRHRAAARVLYPLLRGCRRIALRLLGVKPLAAAPQSDA